MARAPRFKVYTADGEYVAACKYPEDGAAILAAYGAGATIRDGHAKSDVVFTNGIDGDAGNSYDEVQTIVAERLDNRDVRWGRA